MLHWCPQAGRGGRHGADRLASRRIRARPAGQYDRRDPDWQRGGLLGLIGRGTEFTPTRARLLLLFHLISHVVQFIGACLWFTLDRSSVLGMGVFAVGILLEVGTSLLFGVRTWTEQLRTAGVAPAIGKPLMVLTTAAPLVMLGLALLRQWELL